MTVLNKLNCFVYFETSIYLKSYRLFKRHFEWGSEMCENETTVITIIYSWLVLGWNEKFLLGNS